MTSPTTHRGVTLVELLLACGLALIGITFTLLLAADVLRASSRVRQTNAQQAAAHVALYRLGQDISSADRIASGAGTIDVTRGSDQFRWQVSTFQDQPLLTRSPSGISPIQSHAVAAGISGLYLRSSALARTFGLTLSGSSAAGLQQVIRIYGTTL